MHCSLSLVLLLSTQLAPTPAPAGLKDELQEALAQRAKVLTQRAMLEEGAAGLSIVIEKGGRRLLADGYGYAGLDTDALADAETSYRVGPLLENLLCAAVLRLVQEEKLGLDDPLEKLLPELRKEPWKGVRLRHLLAQTSGIPSYSPLLARSASDAFPREVVLAWLGEAALEDEPGTCFEPSPSNLLLLGLIVERRTERGLHAWMQAELFDRLELQSTRWCETGVGPRLRGAWPLPFDAKGLCSSASDLALWMRGLVEGDVIDSRNFELFTDPLRLPDGSSTGRGLGMHSGKLEGMKRYSASSSYARSHAQIAYYPEHDLCVVVMAHGDEVGVKAIEQSLTRVALDLPEPELQDLPLSSEEQQRYVGGDYVGCNRLGIVPVGKRLRLDTAEGPWTTLLYQGHDRFVAQSDPGMSLEFQFEEGKAVAFVLEVHGTQTVARRID